MECRLLPTTCFTGIKIKQGGGDNYFVVLVWVHESNVSHRPCHRHHYYPHAAKQYCRVLWTESQFQLKINTWWPLCLPGNKEKGEEPRRRNESTPPSSRLPEAVGAADFPNTGRLTCHIQPAVPSRCGGPPADSRGCPVSLHIGGFAVPGSRLWIRNLLYINTSLPSSCRQAIVFPPFPR